MKIGIVKEIAAAGQERRVMLLPKEVGQLVKAGHQVYVEKGLGQRVFVGDDEYRQAGARIVQKRKNVFNKPLVVKLKPPLKQEFKLLKNNLLFCMLHAQQSPHYIMALRQRNAKAIAMEMIRNRAGERLVNCIDMAGEQGMIMAFHIADKIPRECNVLFLGYGAIASGALQVAHSLGARVKILRKREYSDIKHFLRSKDIVVNGISWPEEERQKKKYLISRDMLPLLNNRGIILDLSVDYPNPIETCRPTLIDNPVYSIDGIRHISMFGYPGLVPISSSKRYSKQILPLILKIASNSIEKLPKYIRDALIDPANFVY